jgi:hypothetical protein
MLLKIKIDSIFFIYGWCAEQDILVNPRRPSKMTVHIDFKYSCAKKEIDSITMTINDIKYSCEKHTPNRKNETVWSCMPEKDIDYMIYIPHSKKWRTKFQVEVIERFGRCYNIEKKDYTFNVKEFVTGQDIINLLLSVKDDYEKEPEMFECARGYRLLEILRNFNDALDKHITTNK